MSKHFNTATDNLLVTVKNPTDEQLANLENTLEELELPRNHHGFPFTITSGLRPAKKKYSQHQDGYAVDFVPSHDIDKVFAWIFKFCQYDQLILETKTVVIGSKKFTYRWIHMSLKPGHNRHEALTISIVSTNGKETTTVRRYELPK